MKKIVPYQIGKMIDAHLVCDIALLILHIVIEHMDGVIGKYFHSFVELANIFSLFVEYGTIFVYKMHYLFVITF